MKSILDPSFRYVPSAQTDIRKTFARVRRELGKSKRNGAEVNVVPLRQPKDQTQRRAS